LVDSFSCHYFLAQQAELFI